MDFKWRHSKECLFFAWQTNSEAYYENMNWPKKITLFPRQTTIRDCLTDQTNGVLELLIWGWAWWAKTFTGDLRIATMALNYPWTRRAIWRSKLKTLRTTTLKTLTSKILKPYFWFVEWHHYTITGANDNQSPNTLKFYNGSEIILVDLKFYPSLDPEFEDLWSLELTWAFVDEVSQICKEAYETLSMRVWRRRNKEYGLKPMLLMSCNPAKNRVYNIFYKPQKSWTILPHQKFIQVLAKDNLNLEEEYKQKLELMPPWPLRERYLGNRDYDDNTLKIYKFDDLVSLFTNKGKSGEKYIIVDVAWEWKDKTIVTVREWRKIVDCYIERVSTPESVKNIMIALWNYRNVKRQNWIYDWSGLWRGLTGLECKVFQWGSSPIVKDGTSQEEQEATKKAYNNLRSQCFFELAKYIKSWDLSLACDKLEAEKDTIIEELDCIQYRNIDKDGPSQIIPKAEIKKLIGRSPDRADVLSMRLYFELCSWNEPTFW